MYDVETIVREPLLLSPLRRSVECGAKPVYLRSMKAKVTARCNLKCVMCRYGRDHGLPELDTETWLRVLTEAGRLGCRKIHFSGGEVLTRRDFETLVRGAVTANVKVSFTSNFTLLTKERAKSLFSEKISGVSTSLDGASAKVHDAIRGLDGSFKRTVRAIELVGRHRDRDRPRIRVNFVMMRSNFREYPELVRVAADLGVTNVVAMPVDTKQDGLRLSKRLIREYNDDIAPRVLEVRRAVGMPTDAGFVYPFGTSKEEIALSSEGEYACGYYRKHLCYAPYLHAFIAWNGDVYPCCMTNGRIERLGNVQQAELGAIFQGEGFASLRSAMLRERLASCHGCDMWLPENQQLEAAMAHATGEAPRRLPLLQQ